jgi:Na+-transporting NADH:ubiquinone oxidoreductase subunit F
MFLTIFISVTVISSIGAALAALLTVSEHFFNDYGQCRITINNERELEVEGGRSLLSVLSGEKIFIPSACGGRGTCGLCKLKVLEGAGPLLPTEEPYLDEEERSSNVRLSCQVKVRNDLEIEIPPELFSIREYTCKCTEITDLTYDIKLFRFELIEPKEINYVPGQYIQFRAPAYEKSKEEVYRAYSIASDPDEKNVIDLIIRLVPKGICTTYCFEYLKVGDEVKMNGPYGEFELSETDAPIVFIAGGSGMAPIKCMLHHLDNTDSKREIIFYFGASTVEELFLTDLMHQLESKLHSFRYVPVVSTPKEGENWDGQTGLVTQAVNKNLKNASKSEAYLCGSPGMIDASIKVLLELGMSEDNIFYDKFE